MEAVTTTSRPFFQSIKDTATFTANCFKLVRKVFML